MDQISRLIFDVVGRDRGGSKVLNDAATASDRAHLGFSKLSGTLSGLGGPFDQVTMFAGNLGSALDETLTKSQKLGLGLTAIGVGLTAFGAKEQQSQRQLAQAIENTGASESDYRSQIDATIKAQEQHAHTANDTQDALTTLTTATQDEGRALSEMNLVADIAATKHEDLASAATQLVQAQAGNTRAFKSFGIVLDDTLPKSQAIDKALKQLQDRLSGQASASVNTFTGHLKVWGVELEDDIARLAKFGPVMTLVGVGLTAVSTATQILIARRLADTAAAVRETAANMGLAASYDAVAASAGAAGVAQDAAGAGSIIGAGMGARVPGALGLIGRLAVPAAIAYGTYQTAKFTLAKDSSGLTAEQEGKLKQLEGMDPGKLRGEAARVYGITKQLKEYDAQKAADKAASTAAAKANDQYTTSLVKQQSAAATAEFTLKGELKALQDSTSKTMGLSSAQDDLQASMHAMAQAAHDGGTALHGHTLAAEANRNAIRDSVSKMLALIQAEKDAGVSGGKVRQSAIDMAKALEHNATEIYGNKTAVDKLLQSLGVMPHQIANALTSLDSLAPQMGSFFTNLAHDAFGWGQNVGAEFEAGWQAGVNGQGTGTSSPFADPGHPGYQSPAVTKSAKDYGKNVAQAVVSGYAPAVDSGVSAATSKAMDQAKKMADLEKQTADQVRQTFRSIRDQIAGTFNVAGLPTQQDIFGVSMGAADPGKSAHQYVQQLEHWARLLGRLRKQGLNRVMLDQFEQAGVAAIPAMEEILRQHEIPSLNASERRIQRVGRSVAAIDVQRTEGKQLEHVLQRLPHRLAHELARELHHLNINVNLTETARRRGRRVRNKS